MIGDSSHRHVWRIWAVLLIALVVVSALGLLVGRGRFDSEQSRTMFLTLRLWRLLAAFGIGATLSMAGVIIQAIFQNPLAGPSIIGTTAGAALGGQLSLLVYQSAFGFTLIRFIGPEVIVPAGASVGAIVALSLLLLITRRTRGTWVTLLIGFLLSSFFTSIGAYVISKAQSSWELGRAVLAFSMGSISSVGPTQVGMVLAVAIIGFIASFSWHRHLDLLLTGDDEARTFGLDVRQVRRWGIIWAGVLSAGAVAVGGSIAFVGLIVPHAMRRFVGHNTARLLPISALGGGVFVIFCDVLSRIGPGQGETPLGVVTGIIGAPVFLYLLVRAQNEGELHG